MEEKRTFGEIIQENKGRIIKGSLIVAGIAAGVIFAKLIKDGNFIDESVEVIEKFAKDGTKIGFEVLEKSASVAEKVV